MKFGYAWTSGEAPALEKRTASLPRPPAGPRNSNWAASPRRACFRLLGASAPKQSPSWKRGADSGSPRPTRPRDGEVRTPERLGHPAAGSLYPWDARQKVPALLQDILPKGRRPRGPAPCPRDARDTIRGSRAGPDVENDEALGLHLKLDGVRRDEREAHSGHHGLLDRLVRADLDADRRLG